MTKPLLHALTGGSASSRPAIPAPTTNDSSGNVSRNSCTRQESITAWHRPTRRSPVAKCLSVRNGRASKSSRYCRYCRATPMWKNVTTRRSSRYVRGRGPRESCIMKTPIETGSPAAAWELACTVGQWLSQEAQVLSGFWQPILLVGLAMALIGVGRRWARQEAH
jgi:hypothetical protein